MIAAMAGYRLFAVVGSRLHATFPWKATLPYELHVGEIMEPMVVNPNMMDEEDENVKQIREKVWSVLPVDYLYYISVLASKLIVLLVTASRVNNSNISSHEDRPEFLEINVEDIPSTSISAILLDIDPVTKTAVFRLGLGSGSFGTVFEGLENTLVSCVSSNDVRECSATIQLCCTRSKY